jgi:hypothetical protein
MEYVREKPMYRIEIPNAVPPIPYAAPSRKEFSMASRGASRKTAARLGIVRIAPKIGRRNQQKDAWVSQYVCQDQRLTRLCGV